ncbi:putative sulfate/molybdate transporter [Massilia sp. CMS3.1]|uniref:putative sulfate/molybdate transporter n=1 Tax=Massilia sp. CMS3.1 TaxID=3373083 RepID=UPI003EE49AB2
MKDAPPLRFDRAEWSAAFADLASFIPFVVAYISVLKMDPVGILLAFGAALLACGLLYRTPMPVQPMKAIGALAVAHAGVVTQASISAAALVTGAVWLLLGASGAASRLARVIPKEVVQGIVIGLGLSFMLQGWRMMATDLAAAALALAVALGLRRSRFFPAMIVLLAGGLAYGVARDPALWRAADFGFAFRLPALAPGDMEWNDFLVGTLLLALPQLPLTMGNAVIAVTGENNRLFPERPTTVRKVTLSTGAINLAGGLIGGVPMCHGAGGMAAYTAFGARSAGAPIIFGLTLTILALCFSESIGFLLQAVPLAVLGAILFLAGGQLVAGNRPRETHWRTLLPVVLTAAVAMSNAGLGFLAGMTVYWAVRRP